MRLTRNRALFALSAVALTGLLLWHTERSARASGTISLGALNVAYTQDFNTLANSGTSSTIPNGWDFLESGTNANATYTAGTGSSTTGDTYSFGAAASTERALGGLLSGSLTPTIGASFTNNTGGTIDSIDVSYTGEQWRLGAVARVDRLDFQYSTNASSLGTGTWVDVDSLDFTAPVTGPSTGALDGNAAANRTARSFTITGLNIPNGTTFWIRWVDFNATSSDDGLAIDDFSLTPHGTVPVSSPPAGNGLATPNSILPPANTLLTVAVTPGTGPASTSYTVTANLSSIGLSSTQQLFDNGTNGDVTAGDNVFSYLAAVPANATWGVKSIPVSLTDQIGRTPVVQPTITLTIQTPTTCSPNVNIHDVQGPGATSPLVGQGVAMQGIVTARKSNGYFMQNADNQADSDPNTSEGLFVFTGSANLPAAAQVGTLVCAGGTVTEFVPSGDVNSPPVTELTALSSLFTVISTGNPLPTAVTLNAADTPPGGSINVLERLEGMRVRVNSLTVVGPTDGFLSEANATSTSNGVFYGVITGVPRPFREAGVQLPDPLPSGSPVNVPRFDANTEILRVDSLGGGGTAIDVTSGATVTNLAGPLDYNSRFYSIVVEAGAAPGVSGNVSAAPVPTPAANEYTIASFNMERFFDTVNDPGKSDVVLTATAVNNRLNKASLAIRNVLKMPDVLAVEEMENLTILQALAAKISADAVAASQPDPQYTPFLVEGNDVGGIDVGFLVKSTRINVISVTQYGATTPDAGSPGNMLNDRPPLVLRATAKLAGNGTSAPFYVFVNHLRSLNGIDDPTDGARVRAKRRDQAEFLANLIQSIQTSEPGVMIASVGDYNAFRVNDGYVDVMGTIMGNPTPANQVVLASADLVNPNLFDLLDILPASQQYSYVFGGSAQTLDHVLVSPSLYSRLTRFAVARNNADFPEVFRSDANRPERISDHDMPVGYFVFTTATNLTGQVSYFSSGLSLSPVTRTYNGTITVTNTSANTITGPLNLVLNNLTGGVTLANATGTWNGAPYITINVGAGLAPGASVSTPVRFSNPSNLPISYIPVAWSGALN